MLQVHSGSRTLARLSPTASGGFREHGRQSADRPGRPARILRPPQTAAVRGSREIRDQLSRVCSLHETDGPTRSGNSPSAMLRMIGARARVPLAKTFRLKGSPRRRTVAGWRPFVQAVVLSNERGKQGVSCRSFERDLRSLTKRRSNLLPVSFRIEQSCRDMEFIGMLPAVVVMMRFLTWLRGVAAVDRLVCRAFDRMRSGRRCPWCLVALIRALPGAGLSL